MPSAPSPFADREEVRRLLDGFANARIAVVGDFFLDRYVVFDPELDEPSLETGLPAHQVVEVRYGPGAAGTVVNNLVALGAGRIHAVGVIGDDGYGYELRRELERRGVDVSRLDGSLDRFTPTYTKPMLRLSDHEREHERFDLLNRTPTPRTLEDAVLRHVERVLPDVDAVILLDQVPTKDCGVLTQRVRDGVSSLAASSDKLFFADSRGFIGEFRNVMIKPNWLEALSAVGKGDIEEPSEEDLRDAGRALFDRADRAVFLTCGSKGIRVFEKDRESITPAVPVEGPIDVTGAGDSATAGIVLSLCSGADCRQAAFVGNLVASITVQQVGTTGTAFPEQVLERFDRDGAALFD